MEQQCYRCPDSHRHKYTFVSSPRRNSWSDAYIGAWSDEPIRASDGSSMADDVRFYLPLADGRAAIMLRAFEENMILEIFDGDQRGEVFLFSVIDSDIDPDELPVLMSEAALIVLGRLERIEFLEDDETSTIEAKLEAVIELKQRLQEAEAELELVRLRDSAGITDSNRAISDE